MVVVVAVFFCDCGSICCLFCGCIDEDVGNKWSGDDDDDDDNADIVVVDDDAGLRVIGSKAKCRNGGYKANGAKGCRICGDDEHELPSLLLYGGDIIVVLLI